MLGHREKVRASPRGRAKVWALAGEREANTSAVLFLLFGWFYFFFLPFGVYSKLLIKRSHELEEEKKKSNPPFSTSEPFTVKIFDFNGLV